MPELCAIVCVSWWWTVKSVEGFAEGPQRRTPTTVSAPAIAIVTVTVTVDLHSRADHRGRGTAVVPALDRTNARRTARRAPSISGHRVSIFIAGEQPDLANAVRSPVHTSTVAFSNRYNCLDRNASGKPATTFELAATRMPVVLMVDDPSRP